MTQDVMTQGRLFRNLKSRLLDLSERNGEDIHYVPNCNSHWFVQQLRHRADHKSLQPCTHTGKL